MKYPKYWLGEYSYQLGLAVMRQNQPVENSMMIVSIMLPEKPAVELGKEIVALLETKANGGQQ